MQTQLYSLEQQNGARFIDFQGRQIPESFGNVEAEYRALRRSAGIVDLSYRGKLAVSGADRAAYLHRMLSNEVSNLKPGQGNYCFLLDPQGHVQADMNLLVEPARVLLDTEGFTAERLRAQLDRFVIMDQVEIADVSISLGTIGVEGPLARQVLSAVLGVEPLGMNPLDHVSLQGESAPLLVRASFSGEGFWLMAPAATCPELWQKLVRQAAGCGGGAAGHAALEIARVEAGIPRFGQDITEANIPQETEQFRALSFTKGCYPGQEIVERVRSRGHVNRKLVGVTALAGQRLHSGASLRAEGKDAGHITTAVHSPELGLDIALAYVRQEFSQPGTSVQTDSAAAAISPLPFRTARPSSGPTNMHNSPV